jgi:hypothetical protein
MRPPTLALTRMCLLGPPLIHPRLAVAGPPAAVAHTQPLPRPLPPLLLLGSGSSHPIERSGMLPEAGTCCWQDARPLSPACWPVRRRSTPPPPQPPQQNPGRRPCEETANASLLIRKGGCSLLGTCMHDSTRARVVVVATAPPPC